MTAPLITIEPVEEPLTAERVDERLAAGFFPWGQRWMTCRAWPTEEGARDTVWLRVRLDEGRRAQPDRWRRLQRDGATASWLEAPVLDNEHQALYDRFRERLHPDWSEAVDDLLLHGGASALMQRTRELAIRDGDGRLLAYRWYLEGHAAIAGISAVYDPAVSGLGTIARWLVDARAADDGRRWTYPGYVALGAREPMLYKLKRGRTEWLDVDGGGDGRWRSWDERAPRIEELTLARLRGHLAPLGPIEYNPGWGMACVDPAVEALTTPYYVVRARYGELLRIAVWSDEQRRAEEHIVTVRARDEEEPVEPPDEG